MLAYTYVSPGRFELMEKPRPTLQDSRDAIVRVTLASICSSDLHIRRGSVPRAVPGITVGHEMVGVVEETGSRVTRVKPGDRVTVNVETFCGECYFCRHGWVNNCTDPNGGWALGCRIDGGQAEYVRVPYADQGLDRIPSSGRRAGDRVLGRTDREYRTGGYRADYRCGTDGAMYAAMRTAQASAPCDRMRRGPIAPGLRAQPPPGGAHHAA